MKFSIARFFLACANEWFVTEKQKHLNACEVMNSIAMEFVWGLAVGLKTSSWSEKDDFISLQVTGIDEALYETILPVAHRYGIQRERFLKPK